jgi:UDP-N-acetylmuramyl pentapeptide phosphotransferase/UDP-N-acetylglucosamine-1-phosphate transferase
VAEIVPVTADSCSSASFSVPCPFPRCWSHSHSAALLGFAPFNRPVAKLFLGDVGSLPIGLLLFCCSR